jgi:hypothetical protein
MPRSVAKTFTAVLEPLRNGLGWVVARVPFDIKKAWPERRGFRVRGEIAGFAFRSALRPYTKQQWVQRFGFGWSLILKSGSPFCRRNWRRP